MEEWWSIYFVRSFHWAEVEGEMLKEIYYWFEITLEECGKYFLLSVKSVDSVPITCHSLVSFTEIAGAEKSWKRNWLTNFTFSSFEKVSREKRDAITSVALRYSWYSKARLEKEPCVRHPLIPLKPRKWFRFSTNRLRHIIRRCKAILKSSALRNLWNYSKSKKIHQILLGNRFSWKSKKGRESMARGKPKMYCQKDPRNPIINLVELKSSSRGDGRAKLIVDDAGKSRRCLLPRSLLNSFLPLWFPEKEKTEDGKVLFTLLAFWEEKS